MSESQSPPAPAQARSSAETSTDSKPSPYSRENFWGDADSASDSEQSDADTDHDDAPDREWGRHHRFKAPQDKNAILAHRILREGATMLCGETLRSKPYNGGRLAELVAFVFDDECIDGRADAMHDATAEIELSDPQAHIPRAASAEFGTNDSGQYRHRSRVNPETGYLSGHGGSTHVVIADRPTSEFMECVEVAIELFDPLTREARQARNRAKSMKCDPQCPKHDTEIMRDVVEGLRMDEEGSA